MNAVARIRTKGRISKDTSRSELARAQVGKLDEWSDADNEPIAEYDVQVTFLCSGTFSNNGA